MSVEKTREVMLKYLEGKHEDVSMMADDVTFTDALTGQVTETPQGVLQMLNYLYHIAFEAYAEAEIILFGENTAALEGFFIGKHIGEFAGVLATGKDVRVPLGVFYELENDQIKRARFYFAIPVLLQQLGAATQAMPVDPAAAD